MTNTAAADPSRTARNFSSLDRSAATASVCSPVSTTRARRLRMRIDSPSKSAIAARIAVATVYADGRMRDLTPLAVARGAATGRPDRWYWSGSLIEPGALGASEIRRQWLAALHDQG